MDTPTDEERLDQLMQAICNQVSRSEHRQVTWSEVGPSIGLDPENNFDDRFEFRNLARELDVRGYIAWETTWYE